MIGGSRLKRAARVCGYSGAQVLGSGRPKGAVEAHAGLTRHGHLRVDGAPNPYVPARDDLAGTPGYAGHPPA